MVGGCRILFVSADKFPPFRADVSVLFGQELPKNGINIDWLLQSEGDCSSPYQTTYGRGRAWIGSTILGDRPLEKVHKHLLGIGNDLRMLRLLKKNDYDFVQVRNKVIAALIALVACKGSKTKPTYWMSFPYAEASIYEARSGTARYPAFYLLRGWIFSFLLYRLILPKMAHVFVQSEKMKEHVARKGIPVERITSVPMGVKLSDIPFDAKGLCWSADREPRVVYLGTLNRMRQLDFLIRVIAKVRNKIDSVVIDLVGKGDDPEDLAMLLSEVKALNLKDAVRFVGFLPMDHAWEYVRQARVCVSPICPTPILNLGSPTKLIEYMAMGKPVVGNDHPEQKKVLTESGGGLCVEWDEQAFADAIVEILSDPQRAFEMGRKGRRYVERNRDYPLIAESVASKYLGLCHA